MALADGRDTTALLPSLFTESHRLTSKSRAGGLLQHPVQDGAKLLAVSEPAFALGGPAEGENLLSQPRELCLNHQAGVGRFGKRMDGRPG